MLPRLCKQPVYSTMNGNECKHRFLPRRRQTPRPPIHTPTNSSRIICYTHDTRPRFGRKRDKAGTAPGRRKDAMKRLLMLAGAWIACVLGCVGVVVPVLPTTPFLLLSTFLFAKSSPRCHAWIISTKIYKTYVGAFKEAGGIPAITKARILTVSFALMMVSAIVVQKPLVWIILGCVAVFLLYLMLIRIPTVSPDRVQSARRVKEADRRL